MDNGDTDLTTWMRRLIRVFTRHMSAGTFSQNADPIYMYRIYPKYSDTSTSYHICSKIWTSAIHYPMLCLKIAGWVANSVDPDETPRSAASHLVLYCLLRPVCPNTYGKYGTHVIMITRISFCSTDNGDKLKKKQGYVTSLAGDTVITIFYRKYWDTLTLYYTCPKIGRSLFYYLLICLKIVLDDW